MPPLLNDLLSALLSIGTVAAIIFMRRKHTANQAFMRGKRHIDDESAAINANGE